MKVSTLSPYLLSSRLTDVRFVAVLRSVFFFFFCCFLPFVALGKKVVWSFQATEEVKRKAERKVVRKAIQKGQAHKYLVGEQLGKVQGELGNNGWEAGEGEGSSEEESNWLLQATEEMTEEEGREREIVCADASREKEEVKKSKDRVKTKTVKRTMQ